MGSVRRIPVIRHGEDVYAADETKVHTFSRQAIAAMLQTADVDEVKISAPPPPAPPSGVRLKDGSAPPASRMTPVPPPPAVPKVWEEADDDDDSLEPTLLHEKAAEKVAAKTITLEVDDIELDDDIAEAPSAPSSSPALAALTPPSADVKITIAPARPAAAPVPFAPPVMPPAVRARKPQGIDATTIAIFVVTFVGTIAAALRWVL